MGIWMRQTRPFCDALLRDLRVKILPHHDLRLAPATVERIGKSEVLPDLGGVFSTADEVDQHVDALRRLARQRQGQAATATDLATPPWMRAPGAVSGMFALESAMDELAYALKIDPLELRLINYAEVDPESGKPFSSKALARSKQRSPSSVSRIARVDLCSRRRPSSRSRCCHRIYL